MITLMKCTKKAAGVFWSVKKSKPKIILKGFLLVGHTLNALQKLVSFHRKKFIIPIVGITGSNGKTIVKEWLAQCLAQKQNITRSPKSYNSQIGVPLSVWLLNQQSEMGIFEAGISQVGEMENLEKVIHPTMGIITNIGTAHQANFSSLEQKAKEKMKLFVNCHKIYYCSDYENIDSAATKLSQNKALISWSLKGSPAKLQFRLNKKEPGEIIVSLTNKAEEPRFTIPFTDNASIENCLHIINFLLDNGFSTQEINQGLSKLQPVAMRLELVKGINNCTLINDTYNSDINSLSIALDYLHQQPQKNKSVILSDIQQSGEKDEELYQHVAERIQKSGVTHFIGIGRNIGQYQHVFQNIKSEFYTDTQQLINSGKLHVLHDRIILLKAAREFRVEKAIQALSEKNHTTILEINLNNLVSNLNYFRSLLHGKTGIMVMVKAFAYGSGSYEIANLLQHEQVNYLGVAFTDEGIQLRQAGITLPIMVMSPNKEDFSKIIEYNLEPEIYSFSTLELFIEAAKSAQVQHYPIHLKLDTGMHRLGFQKNDIQALIGLLNETKTLHIQSIFSHLAGSDAPELDDFSRQQISGFTEMYQTICSHLAIRPMRHILNSAGIERFPEAHFELVRLGIGLHGISQKRQLQAVSSLKTHISQIKKIPKGDTVGYNRSGIAPNDIAIAIIPIGYADGLDRKFGNKNGEVIINHKKATFIGNVCMDMSMIDISGIDCKEGDEVLIFGEGLPITELAEKVNTIPYEILTNVSSRVKRVYYKD